MNKADKDAIEGILLSRMHGRVILDGKWQDLRGLPRIIYICGNCGARTGSSEGYESSHNRTRIYICGGCNRPTFYEGDKQSPEPILGNEVLYLPETIHAVYEEARRCTQVNAYTACVLLCRKILMNVAVEKSAKEGLTFVQYVDYLLERGYVPPDGKAWLGRLRERGNEATHKVIPKNKEEAYELLSFAEMLLKFVYEFPGRMMPPPSALTS